MDLDDDVDIEERYHALAELIGPRLARNKRVRRNLPGAGRLRIDRQLPFLCLYRNPSDRDDAGTRELVTTEAAYLFASGDDDHAQGLQKLCQTIVSSMQEHFGTFLLFEIWSAPEPSEKFAFEIVTPELDTIPSTVETLESALAEISLHHQLPKITKSAVSHVVPPGLPAIDLSEISGNPAASCVIGLQVSPVYRDTASDTLYPIVLDSLRRQLAVAIRKTVAQFTGTTPEPESKKNKVKQKRVKRVRSYQSLGPSSLVQAARLVDQQLVEISESFDFLLQVTPINSDAAWNEFHEGGCREVPRLHYRPLPYHPNLLKRRLFDIEIERIEDPTLAYLFWEKQEEIDRKLTALRDLDTPNFFFDSLQLFGSADESLVELSRTILEQNPDSPTVPDSEEAHRVCAQEMMEHARQEFDYYHTQMNEFNATVEESEEIASGMMVSRDRLLISHKLNISGKRVEPLLHHEIGTHLLTYFNGRCQPFRHLYAGLSGYEELQEGLAVLTEYLVGGLTSNRVRTLAGRVLAVHSLTEGNSFLQTFELLHHEFGFSPQRAFTTTLRVYRGGGLTKDVIYLRGLILLHDYLTAGHDIEPLYVGKIGLHHVPFVQELRRRQIIVPPRILPRIWDDDRVQKRLEACRKMSILELLEAEQ
ncbi:MAG: flavohemoglobin expression-modulating QEGLA motif protein [Planctomyces sp.]|nr:flavohemoglobin expression-modulating QEGLA motif protein [Planctomyces sp.]